MSRITDLIAELLDSAQRDQLDPRGADHAKIDEIVNRLVETLRREILAAVRDLITERVPDPTPLVVQLVPAAAKLRRLQRAYYDRGQKEDYVLALQQEQIVDDMLRQILAPKPEGGG